MWSGLLTTFQARGREPRSERFQPFGILLEVVNIDGWVSLMHRFEDAKLGGTETRVHRNESLLGIQPGAR